MADVNKVKGNISQPEPEKAKKKESDLEEIREKWGKVGKTDAEQQKKKKPKAQEEEEERVKQTSAPGQGLEAKPKEPSIYEPKAGRGPQVGEGAKAGPLPPSEPPPFYPEPMPLEEAPPIPPEHKKKVERKRKAPLEPTQKLKKAKKAKMETPPLTPAKKLEKEAEALLKKGEPKEKIEPPKKKQKVTQEALPLPPEPLPKGAWEAIKEPEKKEKEAKKIKAPPPSLPPATTAQPPAAPPVGPTPAPLVAPFAHLSLQVQQLFDRMVGVMTVMHASGITETTLNLDNPKFAESVFYGAQIVITEFSTAPKVFNIKLLGNQKAVNLFSTNAEDLVAAFQAGNYNFKVNRIDTGYLPPTGEAKRKKARQIKRKKGA
ncbi:MAG: hypothetical protein K1000chlam3_01094 [Chlamydiae bacterium]|nr:hypothetical protein [Chlamydiota bacterium]